MLYCVSGMLRTCTRLRNLSFDITTKTPCEFGAFLHAEIERWGKVVKATGIKPE